MAALPNQAYLHFSCWDAMGWWSEGHYKDKLYNGQLFPFRSMFPPWHPTHSSSPHGHFGRRCTLTTYHSLLKCHQWIKHYHFTGKFHVTIKHRLFSYSQICTYLHNLTNTVLINVSKNSFILSTDWTQELSVTAFWNYCMYESLCACQYNPYLNHDTNRLKG